MTSTSSTSCVWSRKEGRKCFCLLKSSVVLNSLLLSSKRKVGKSLIQGSVPERRSLVTEITSFN